MAAAKAGAKAKSKEPDNADDAGTSKIPSITKISIRNFGCIGSKTVHVEIDKIVILIGANNSGKSTILRAIEVVAENSNLTIDDFHNKAIDAENLPEIIIESVVIVENKPGDEWCKPINDNEFAVKERWLWKAAETPPERYGFLWGEDRWAQDSDAEKGPWGMANKAKTRRPKPHRVGTFDSPEVQSNAITSLFAEFLQKQIEEFEPLPDSEIFDLKTIREKIGALKKHIKDGQTVRLQEVNKTANELIEKIFPNQVLSIQAKATDDEFKIPLISDEYAVEFGSKGGILFPIEKQGSGTRRTILWTILKLLADMGLKAKDTATKGAKKTEALGKYQSHILLLDEPELSLHPSATSNARDVLYSLPNNQNWQVIVATHSPNFVDLTKDHTTIIRVELDQEAIKATTLYRPERAKLSDDDKENLKIKNAFDSHISEAFFGGSILVVEGDTEYSAFNYIKDCEKSKDNNAYRDLHIIRARGKVTIASMMKVLNHFKAKYFVLHDLDTKTTESKKLISDDKSTGTKKYKKITIANPAWTNNGKIAAEFSENAFVCASVPNFEMANFSETVEKEKPESCLHRLKTSPDDYSKIKNLLDAIISADITRLPEGTISWTDLSIAESAIDKWKVELD